MPRGNYRRVDDRPFGGGPGMVMMADLERCLNHIREQRGEALDTQAPGARTPIGRKLNHAEVEVGLPAGAILLWVATKWTSDSSMRMSPMQLSLAILLLSGGEIAALALLDAVARLQPGC